MDTCGSKRRLDPRGDLVVAIIGRDKPGVAVGLVALAGHGLLLAAWRGCQIFLLSPAVAPVRQHFVRKTFRYFRPRFCLQPLSASPSSLYSTLPVSILFFFSPKVQFMLTHKCICHHRLVTQLSFRPLL